MQAPILLIMKLSPSNPELPIIYNYKILVSDSIAFEDYQNFMSKFNLNSFLREIKDLHFHINVLIIHFFPHVSIVFHMYPNEEY